MSGFRWKPCVDCRFIIARRTAIMTAVSILASIQSVERFIRSEVRMGIVSRESSVAEQIPNVLQLIRARDHITQDDATAVMEHLLIESDTFDDAQRKVIAKAVKSTMSCSAATATSRPHKAAAVQEHRYIHRYLPMMLWVFLRSADSFTNKAKQLAQFMVKSLGLRNPSEKTRRLAVALIHMASNIDPDPIACLQNVREFRDICEAKRDTHDTAATMLKFPSDVEGFIRLYPTTYIAEHPPVKSQVDEADLMERCRPEVTPVRGSNRMVQQGTRAYGKSTPSAASSSCFAMLPSTSVDFSQQLQLQQLHMLRDYMNGRTSTVPHIPLAIEDAPRPSLNRAQVIVDGGAAPPTLADGLAPLVIAGAAPGCLSAIVVEKETPADKMAELRQKIKDDLAAAKGAKKPTTKGADSKTKAKAKKVVAADSDADREDTDGDDDREDAESSTAPKATKGKKGKTAKPVGDPKAKAADKEEMFKRLLKRPASKERPKFSKKPTPYNGGKIYWSGPKGSLRVYARTPDDKVEQTVKVDGADKADHERAWSIACAMIESDPRPVLAKD